jgi:hypothetical protein
MDYWHVLLSAISVATTVALLLNWFYFRIQLGMQKQITAIVDRLDRCPGFCTEHTKKSIEIEKIFAIDEKLDRIYRLLLYLIKKSYFHRHGDDGKTIIMADGLDEFIKEKEDK